MKLFIAIMLLFACMFIGDTALAKPQILSWTWPIDDCDGEVLAQSDLRESELIYSAVPMPMPSDSSGPCATAPDPGPPAGSLLVPVPITGTSIILNLQPGQTYYARIRVSAYANGNWSSWSNETVFTVPYGRPNRVIMGSGLGRIEYYLIEDPVIVLFGSKS